jgi:hypothetical protein
LEQVAQMTKCIFCPNPADSKEDMFPRWIHKKVKTREPLSRKLGDIQAEITQDQEVRIKCVCETCNNGWMSRLEMKCKPIVGSLLEDLSLRLDAEHRKFLSEWALKTAMVTDACEGRTRFFTDAECHAFKSNNRKIPEGTGVWAGRFTGRTLSAIGSEFRLDSPTAQGVARGQVFTICAGHLILQVLSLHKQPGIASVTVAASLIKWEAFLVLLWPPSIPKTQKLAWPPQYNFALVENPNFGNLHYARLIDRWNVKDGHSLKVSALAGSAKSPS